VHGNRAVLVGLGGKAGAEAGPGLLGSSASAYVGAWDGFHAAGKWWCGLEAVNTAVVCFQPGADGQLFEFCAQLMGVEAFLAHHHAGDVGPPPAWGGIADDGPDAPCAVAGMFGCAPMNSTYDYWKNGVPWEGPPVVFH